MKKNIILFISFLLIITSFFSGCSNNNNSLNSKITIELLDFQDGNLTGEQFKDVAPPPNYYKFVYVKLKITNLLDKKILTNPYYNTIIDNEGNSYLHFAATMDLPDQYFKNYINPKGFYQGGLIYLMKEYSIPIKLQYFDPINKINITIPLIN